ncbi:secreted RxLR effector protein 161-like [Diospyros lotus]|uniref:secreted RxLR effector protein 161-like n=1 Tax=Diospyros lotus TaxID=55363 RepID=UPI0022563E31|nr:secreted RxLR effector protein 161-like [Diospyros lotus]
MASIPYAFAVGSLIYAQVCTRPDIIFVVNVLGRYQSNLGIEHWKAAKKVMRYFQGTKDYRHTYKHSDNLEVIRYTDSDFAGCIDTRKSTSGYIFLLTGGVVSWRSNKQTIIASSTMEVEFISCSEATTQALWLRNFVKGLKVVDSKERPLNIYYDNSVAIFFSRNNKSGSRSKHININYLVVRDHIKKDEVVIKYIKTYLMIADPMTKDLPTKVYKEHVESMGLVA